MAEMLLNTTTSDNIKNDCRVRNQDNEYARRILKGELFSFLFRGQKNNVFKKV